MKSAVKIGMAVGLIFCFQFIWAQNASKQKGKNTFNKYVGKWKGSEKCADVSAPVALLFVTAGSGNNVQVSGIYSIQGEINGTIAGDTLVIPRQPVKDPNFMNMVIEGKLAFGTNPFNLSGNIIVVNNQKKDECFVKYYK
jgi:hypothetical protein